MEKIDAFAQCLKKVDRNPLRISGADSLSQEPVRMIA
jgi:hypothetical protein